ncbi:MAG: hypothetical protein AAFX79_03790 [Planctomycetota bacterium]
MSRARHERGAAYLLALMVASITSAAGLAALSIATTKARTSILEDDFSRAQLNARSGSEHAMRTLAASIADGTGWRANLSGLVHWQDVDRGQFAWRFTEFDGSTLLDNGDGPVRLAVRGVHSEARYRVEATFVPSGDPLDVLEVGLYCGNDLYFGAGATITSDVAIATGANADAPLGSTINADVEAVGTINGSTYSGTTTAGASARRLPDPSLVTYYNTRGTVIPLASLPNVLGTRYLQDVLLSDASNPYGTPNEEGIYIVDCAGANIVVTRCRIVGTLVLINPGLFSTIGAGVLIQGDKPYMPALVVDGSITFAGTTAGPDEAASGINFNPEHTPYLGDGDDDQVDAYPSGLRGLVYVDGDMTFAFPRMDFVGTVIATGRSSALAGATITIQHDPQIPTLPPVGAFVDEGAVALDPESWIWTW